MLKLPKGLKKKKKKSKKDQELFTEEELEQYKRELKAKQDAAAAKSDAGESDGASDAEGLAQQGKVSISEERKRNVAPAAEEATESTETTESKGEADEEWAKFKALTSGLDTILHKTQDELDRIKKESFYQRLPSALEKKRLEEEEEAKKETERLEVEKRRAAEVEARRDKLAEAVVELSDFEEENDDIDDIFVTDYVEAITSGEIQFAVVPDSPLFEEANGPDPFDTDYAEKVIVGADKAKGNKKLVSLGAAVEVLSGRVDRDHALALAKPKRKLRKGIQNLLLSESVDYEESELEIVNAYQTTNLLDELVADGLDSEVPIDLSISLHLHLIKPKHQDIDEEECAEEELFKAPDLSEFDTLKEEEDDEFAELAAESLTKKEEVKVIKEITLPTSSVFEAIANNWAEFEILPEEEEQKAKEKAKPGRPPRPVTGPHIVPGAVYISDDEEENFDDDPFNTSYAEQVIKKTTDLEEDEDFDPRAGEKKNLPPPKPQPPAGNFLKQPARDLLAGSNTDLSKVGAAPIEPELAGDEEEDFDPFDTSTVGAIVLPKSTELKVIERELLTVVKVEETLSDDDFDPRAEETRILQKNNIEFDPSRRKSSLSLNLQQRSVGFAVTSQDLLATSNGGGSNKKPLTPYYAQPDVRVSEEEDPFNTSYIVESKPTEIELKHIEKDLLQESTLNHSLSDPDFNPRAPPTPVPAEELLTVRENIDIKVLTPAQERKIYADDSIQEVDPFDTSIAANLKPAEVEIKLLESELLPQIKRQIITGVLDTETDAQELGLGDKVLTPLVPKKQISVVEDLDPFDTSIAENLAPGQIEIKLIESELIN